MYQLCSTVRGIGVLMSMKMKPLFECKVAPISRNVHPSYACYCDIPAVRTNPLSLHIMLFNNPNLQNKIVKLETMFTRRARRLNVSASLTAYHPSGPSYKSQLSWS